MGNCAEGQQKDDLEPQMIHMLFDHQTLLGRPSEARARQSNNLRSNLFCAHLQAMSECVNSYYEERASHARRRKVITSLKTSDLCCKFLWKYPSVSVSKLIGYLAIVYRVIIIAAVLRSHALGMRTRHISELPMIDRNEASQRPTDLGIDERVILINEV